MQGARLLSAIARNAVQATTRRAYTGQGHKTSLNLMPIPEGDFMAHHARRQTRYHTVLATGVLSLGFALFLLGSTDLVKLHYTPPRSLD
ncbi:unnamed protein product [Diamesa serratosioi]